MESRLNREIIILPSVCDSSARLGIPGAFALFMDIATEHALCLGCGMDVLGPRGLFWLAVRTRVRIRRAPAMLERVTLSTWPEPPGKLRTNRDYTITQNGALLLSAKTEWTVLDQNAGRLRPVADVFPAGFAFPEERVWDEPFTHMRDEPLEEYARRTVRSADIDLGGHMNNAAYLRSLAGTFSCEAWQELDIREAEFAYRAPCYEGDTLVWQKRDEGDTLRFRAALPDGKTIALARLVSSRERSAGS